MWGSGWQVMNVPDSVKKMKRPWVRKERDVFEEQKENLCGWNKGVKGKSLTRYYHRSTQEPFM